MQTTRMLGPALVMRRRPQSRRLPDMVLDTIPRLAWIAGGADVRRKMLSQAGYGRLRVSAELVRNAARLRQSLLDAARLGIGDARIPEWLWDEIGVVPGWDTAHLPLLTDAPPVQKRLDIRAT